MTSSHFGGVLRDKPASQKLHLGRYYSHDKHQGMQSMCECVERQHRSLRVLMCLSAGECQCL